jgi:hypothetical protein
MAKRGVEAKVRILIDKLFLRLSRSRHVNGIWVGVIGDKKDVHLLQHVEDAILLIERYDSQRYRRVCSALERIWVCPLAGSYGEYNAVFRRCDLDLRYVRSSSVAAIASTIVHEATHGHYCLRKIGYPEALRHRIERICMQQQLAFARTLPDQGALCKQLERNLDRNPESWNNEAFKRLRLKGELETARDLGIPDWVTKSAQTVGAAHAWLRWRLRRITTARKS